MLIKETLENGSIRTYSDLGVLIRKVGTDEKYLDAVDVSTSNFEYEETDEKIPDTQEPEEEINNNITE